MFTRMEGEGLRISEVAEQLLGHMDTGVWNFLLAVSHCEKK